MCSAEHNHEIIDLSGNALITIEYDLKDDESQFNCINLLHNQLSNTIENRYRKALPNRFWQPCSRQVIIVLTYSHKISKVIIWGISRSD